MPCWRNWIARKTSNLKVVGSSPTQGIFNINTSQLSRVVKGVALKMPCVSFVGSNPTVDICLISSVGRAQDF